MSILLLLFYSPTSGPFSSSELASLMRAWFQCWTGNYCYLGSLVKVYIFITEVGYMYRNQTTTIYCNKGGPNGQSIWQRSNI